MRKTIPVRTKKDDVRAPRERGEKDNPNTCTAEPRARERHRGEHSSQGGRAEDRRPWWRIWWSQHQSAPGMHGIEGQLKVSLGSGENDEVTSTELATEVVRETPGMPERRVTARLSICRLKRRGERILPCAMPESTQGEETEPPRRTWDRVPHRKLARRCQRDPVTPKLKRRTRVASTQQESKAFLMSMNATKVCS